MRIIGNRQVGIGESAIGLAVFGLLLTTGWEPIAAEANGPPAAGTAQPEGTFHASPRESARTEMIPGGECSAIRRLYPKYDAKGLDFGSDVAGLCERCTTEVEGHWGKKDPEVFGAFKVLVDEVRRLAVPAATVSTGDKPLGLGGLLRLNDTKVPLQRVQDAMTTVQGTMFVSSRGQKGQLGPDRIHSSRDGSQSFGMNMGTSLAVRVSFVPVGVKEGGIAESLAVCRFIDLYHHADSFSDTPTFKKDTMKVSRTVEGLTVLAWCWKYEQTVGTFGFFDFATIERCPGLVADFESFFWPTAGSKNAKSWGIDGMVLLPEGSGLVQYVAFITVFRSNDINAAGATRDQHLAFIEAASKRGWGSK